MRPARIAFERCNQRRLLAANKRTRALHQFDVEMETAVQNVRAQQPIFARLLDGLVEPPHGQRILGADVNDALGSAHHIAADDHTLQQRMRVALDLVAVHVSAGVALVGVANNVFFIRLRFGQKIPLVPGKEARAAASTQPRGLDLLNDRLAAPIDQHL